MESPIITMPGFIFLHRDIANHWVWKDGRIAHRWMDLLIQAEYENRTVFFDGVRVDLKRGQFVTTTRLLMGRWRTNPRTVLKVLDMFESDKMIRCKKTNEMTIISICNFDEYQSIPRDQNPSDISPYSSAIFDAEVEQKGKRKKKRIKEYNKKEEIIEENNLSQPREIVEEDFFEKLKSDKDFFEKSALSLHCEIEMLKSLFDDFVNECKAKNKAHIDFDDFRQHFFDWARKQVQNYGKREKSRGSGGAGTQDRHEARRGTDVAGKSESDYGKPF